MRLPGFVLGFHGCDRALGERVLAGREALRPSDNNYDWLGAGIYFWENSPRRALDWAQRAQTNRRITRGRVRTPFVIGAVLNLGNCLDLLEAESIRVVRNAHGKLTEALKATGDPLPENQRTPTGDLPRLDCMVINYAHWLREQTGQPPLDSVRAAFVEGEPIYPTAGFHAMTHIQICVREEAQVVGYFRPRQWD